MPFRMLLTLLLLLPAFAWSQQTSISNNEKEQLLKVKLRTVQQLAFNPVILTAVREQNAQNLSMETIRQRDADWTATAEPTPFKRGLQNNKAGKLLGRHVESNEFLVEAFLTDNQGANVAAYPITSDYWQGDEEKWTAAFNNGQGKLYIGPIEVDASTNIASVQVSSPVIESGKTIGVLIVGIAFDYLKAKQEAGQ